MMEITEFERQKISDEIKKLMDRCAKSHNQSALYETLCDYAKSEGCIIYESSTLQISSGSLGLYYPIKVIFIQVMNVTRMVSTLAHEIGHLICDRVGILRKYAFGEDLADRIGAVILDLLTNK